LRGTYLTLSEIKLYVKYARSIAELPALAVLYIKVYAEKNDS